MQLFDHWQHLKFINQGVTVANVVGLTFRLRNDPCTWELLHSSTIVANCGAGVAETVSASPSRQI